MKSASPERVEELLALSRTRELTHAERDELNRTLRDDANARRVAARWLLDDAALAEELRATQVERLFHEEAAEATATPRRMNWWQWRPLAAAAAGLVFGLFCASVAWSYAGTRAMDVFERIVPMVNGDFEQPAAMASDGVPKKFGEWSGDFARGVTDEQQISPKSGRRMLRVLRSDSRVDPPGLESHGGDMMQLVDLRPFKPDFSSGNAVLEVSASGNMIAPRQGEGYSFAVTALAFNGEPADLSWDASENAQAALAASTKRVPLDADPATWQTPTTRLLLPPDADFVMVKLTVTLRGIHPPGHVEFAGHYVDSVRLALKTQPARPVHVVSR